MPTMPSTSMPTVPPSTMTPKTCRQRTRDAFDACFPRIPINYATAVDHAFAAIGADPIGGATAVDHALPADTDDVTANVDALPCTPPFSICRAFWANRPVSLSAAFPSAAAQPTPPLLSKARSRRR